MAKQLTVAETAEAINKSVQRVRQMIYRNEIKTAEKRGRDWMIDAKEIPKLLKRPHQRNLKKNTEAA